jgi:hypothetical protein
VPNTYSTKIPKKLQVHSMTLTDPDTMTNHNFKSLFSKIEKGLKTLKSNKPEDILLIVDNINILFNSCYSNNNLD